MFTNLVMRLVSKPDVRDLISVQRDVGPFDHVLLTDYGDLLIVQGDAPGLTITTHKTLVDRIESQVRDGRLHLGFGTWQDRLSQASVTSLGRKLISYRLTITGLVGLETRGAAQVRGEGLSSDTFTIRTGGVASVHLKKLQAARLEAHMTVGGRIVLDGEVKEQRLAIKGPVVYHSPDLVSREASIEVEGLGQATVNVQEHLSVAIKGPGRVLYHGSPVVEKRLAGLAFVQQITAV